MAKANPLKRKTDITDAVICIKCFIGLMKTKTLPGYPSPFSKICEKIVKDNKPKGGGKK